MSATSAKFQRSRTPVKWLLLLILAAALLLLAFNDATASFLGLPIAATLYLAALTSLALLHFRVGHQIDEWALRFYLWFFCLLFAGSFACTSIPVDLGPLAWITAKGKHVSCLQAAFVALQQVFHLGLSMAARRADRQELKSPIAPEPFAVIPSSAIDLELLWPCQCIIGDRGAAVEILGFDVV